MKLPSPRRASCGSLLIALLVCGATPGLTQAGTVPATEIPDGSRVSLQTVGVFPNLQMPAAMELSGDRAYVLDSKGLSIFDISRPDRPEMLGTTPASGNYLALGDGLALVGVPGSFSVIDVRNPSHPTNVAQHSVRMQVSMTASVALTGLAMNGRLAYVGFPGGGLMVYDLSDPAKLEFRGGLNPSGDPGFSGYGGGGITSLHEDHVVITQTDSYGPTCAPQTPDGVRLVKKNRFCPAKSSPTIHRASGSKVYWPGGQATQDPEKPRVLGDFSWCPPEPWDSWSST